MPLYVVEGPIEGVVSFAYYRLKYFGEPLEVYEFEVVKCFSAPIAIYVAYEALSGLYLIKSIRGKGGARLPLRLCFSGGLAGLVVGGIVLGLSAHYLNRAVSSLFVNLSHSTTAGLLILGSSAVVSMWYTPLLANPLAFLSLSASTVAISALAVLIEEGLTRRTGLGMDV